MKLSSKIILFLVGSIAIVGIGAMILFNDEKENNEVVISDTEQQNNLEDTELKVTEEVEEDNKLVYWINSKEWSNIIVEDIKIFNDKISLPINLENIDICSAPYSFWPNGVDQTNVEKIEDILTFNEQMGEGRKSSISTQTKFEDGWKDFDEEPDNIERIYIKNYSEEPHSVAQCYNNGWWYIDNEHSTDGAFGFKRTELPGYKGGWNELPVLDEVVKRIGDPSVVWVYMGDLENDGSVYYDLIYERDEYVVILKASELILKENDGYMGTVNGMRYYPREAWEKEHGDIIVDNEIMQNGMKIQFVKNYSDS